jgi:murein L,D-transpeptidase YcbB/YkuD
MNYMVLNPYWVVPTRIGREEILPRVRKNPAYLDSQQMEMIAGWGRTARLMDPYSVDWASVSDRSFPYRFRQRPGNRNALGQVKFKFPNPFSIYMHDTQAKSLFAKSRRAYSHGCVRLERPIELAEFLLRDTSWTPERVGQTLDQGRRSHVNLKSPIDVHIMYQTAWVDEYSVVQFRRDIYGHDRSQQKRLCSSLNYLCS